MKPKTVAGKTRPEPTQKDCDQLDRAIDLVLLYKQYESDDVLLDKAENAVAGLLAVAKRCNALLEATKSQGAGSQAAGDN